MSTIGQRALTKKHGPVTPEEQMFLDSVRIDLLGLESRTRGRFAETLVLRSLGKGAHRSTYAAASWDICWKGITIAVRTVGQYNSETDSDDEDPRSSMRWTFPKRSTVTAGEEWSKRKRRVWTDAVVLAIHRGRDITEGWSFIVLDGKTLDDEGVPSVGIDRALALAVHEEELTLAKLRRVLTKSFDVQRELTKGATFPVSCDDETAHRHSLRRG